MRSFDLGATAVKRLPLHGSNLTFGSCNIKFFVLQIIKPMDDMVRYALQFIYINDRASTHKFDCDSVYCCFFSICSCSSSYYTNILHHSRFSCVKIKLRSVRRLAVFLAIRSSQRCIGT